MRTALSCSDIRETLEPEDIFALLVFLKADPRMESGCIVSRTVCHQGDSHKLYYYLDSHLFHCYTDCSESFDVFTLVQKVFDMGFRESLWFIVDFFDLRDGFALQDDGGYPLEDKEAFERYDAMRDISVTSFERFQLPIYDESILAHYPQVAIPEWEEQGIDPSVSAKMGIRYDPVGGNILIPHRDDLGNLIGIRQRTLLKDGEKLGKYRPWVTNGKMYNHPLAFNLYGMDVSKDNIRKAGIAIAVESEKAVLMYGSYFGMENCICVAVCGSSISQYQFNLLMDNGVKELVVAFDRDFQSPDDPAREKVEDKLYRIFEKFGSMVNVSFLFDGECRLLGYKDSPLDKGRETFLELFRDRVVI